MKQICSFPRSLFLFHLGLDLGLRLRRLTLVESTVSILFGCFEAPLFTPENSLAKITFNTRSVFDETLHGNVV